MAFGSKPNRTCWPSHDFIAKTCEMHGYSHIMCSCGEVVQAPLIPDYLADALDEAFGPKPTWLQRIKTALGRGIRKPKVGRLRKL